MLQFKNCSIDYNVKEIWPMEILKQLLNKKDQIEVVLNCKTIVSTLVNSNLVSTGTGSVVESDKYKIGAINVWDSLLHSEFFNNYAPMYDQVKIDKIKAKFTSLQYPQSGTGNATVYNINIEN